MCHVFPCVKEKAAFSTRDSPIDKRDFFLLGGRAVSVVGINVCKKSRF